MSRAPSEALTFEEHACYLLPRLRSDSSVPEWPPDVFAICSSLLVKSGAYCRILEHWPPSNYDGDIEGKGWPGLARALGREWRSNYLEGLPVPERVANLWDGILKHRSSPLTEVFSEVALWQQVLELACIADESCRGVGNAIVEGDAIDQSFVFMEANPLLAGDEAGATLCKEISSSRVRVLPKMHTPQSGITIRSFSLNLCLCTANEVVPRWSISPSSFGRESINVLIIPWPFYMEPVRFESVNPGERVRKNLSNRFGYFTLEIPSDQEIVELVRGLIKQAMQEVGAVHGVVVAAGRKVQSLG
jgi:hypothetical protein